MDYNIQFSYENQNQNSYLMATIPPLKKVIEYQLQMMTSNEIPGLLTSMKRQSNENILIYYNITSRISLGQILNRRKLSRKEFLTLLSGIIKTWKEMQEYQLESDGLYLKEDYIFVTSDTCEPAFVFLPICARSQGIESVKNFIQSLILKGVIETSNDNFIQILLNTMNEDTFQISSLEACIEKLSMERRAEKSSTPKVEPPKPSTSPAPPSPVPTSNPIPPTSVPHPAPSVRDEVPPAPAPKPQKPKKDIKKTIMLIQAVIAIAAAAGISFVAFQKSGHYEYIAAVVLAVAAVEFVIYRELFVNNKEKAEKTSKESKKESKKEKKPARARGGRAVEIPGGEGKNISPASSGFQKEAPVTPPPVVQTPPVQSPPPVPQPPVNQMPHAPQMLPGYDDTVMEEPSEGGIEETDFWDPQARPSEVYLEYTGDGSGTRIMFQNGRLLVGRLVSQVDFAVNNPKVGKMHAEFICQNGQCFVQDLNSKNGTYINGSEERLTSNMPYPLQNGDRVSLADSEFVIHC